MKRFVIMTIGVTHSGKTSFGKDLELALPTSVVIDQDNHATFLNTIYPKLVPIGNENTLKIGLSQFILNYIIEQTNFNIIISSANLSRNGRIHLLDKFFPSSDWHRVYVYFNLPKETILTRIQNTTRSASIFRDSSITFEQLVENHYEQLQPPFEENVDELFEINDQLTTSQLLNVLKVKFHQFQ